MSAETPGGTQAESNGQLLPERIAELASEMSEAAEDKPRRQRLGHQLAELANRSRQATWRSGVTAARRVRPATDAAVRRARPATDAAARGFQASAGAARKGVRGAATAAKSAASLAGRRGPRGNRPDDRDRAPAGGEVAEQRAQAAGNLARASGNLARRGGDLARSGGDLARRGGDLARAGGDLALKGALASRSVTARRTRAAAQWLTAQALTMAPKVPIRTEATLRAQYPGRDTEAIADGLISGAAKASASLGAAVGAAAVVPFPTTPGDLVVETLGVVAIELKLIAELHEIYGMPATGTRPQRMLAYVGAWADRRGVSVTADGLALAVGSPLRRKLERRLLVRASQSALALAPLLAGAVAGAAIDHRETRRLGNLVRADLRKRAISPA